MYKFKVSQGNVEIFVITTKTIVLKYIAIGTSLVAQWLRPHTPNAGGPGSFPAQGNRSHMHASAKSLHATTKELTCHN